MESTSELIAPHATTQALKAPAPAGKAPLSSRERFLNAALGKKVDHPPIWIMRQAGRALPEYRALKENFTFLELVRTPQLAAEVTLQPIRRFGFDAAILFSDILVVPEAMGQRYFFRETGGVEMEFPIDSASDVERLAISRIREKLGYVPAAIRLIKRELKQKTALIGFAGSPWTLANFMLEGGSCKEPKRSLDLLRRDERTFTDLMEKLTCAVIDFLQMQVAAGVDAVQIFDSHGGLLPANLFRAGSGKWIDRIVRSIEKVVPTIVFSKGTRAWSELAATGADVIGVDHGIALADAVDQLPDNVAVQGNLDPELLLGDPEMVRKETQRLISQMDGRNGWIFNLGHGLPPTANLDCITAIIETLRR